MVYIEILVSLVFIIVAYMVGRLRDNNKYIFEKKLEIYSQIIVKINTHDYLSYVDEIENSDSLVKLFAPARLIGRNYVVNGLREYFSLVSNYFDSTDISIKSELKNKISSSAMELEQLMRKDLVKYRNLSKDTLFFHIKK